jgi:hypothetical protein
MVDTAAAGGAVTSAYPFTDPVSGRGCVVHFGVAPGIEHPDCTFRAQVSPELDAFYCTHCRWKGRISGAWFMDLLTEWETATARQDGTLVTCPSCNGDTYYADHDPECNGHDCGSTCPVQTQCEVCRAEGKVTPDVAEAWTAARR